MKVVIFAGGVGTRLWPLSRKNTPKQFEKIVGDKSTLQLAVERILPLVNPSDILISSGAAYKDTLFQQLPSIPKENFILEPEMRDVGAAVGLVTAILNRLSPDEPFIILWSDHLVKNENLFVNVLKTIGKILEEDKNKIVFIGQKSRFGSQNLGWIESGDVAKEVDGVKIHRLKSFHYRPDLDTARAFHDSPHHTWNPGYFGTTASFLFHLYKKFAPDMHAKLDDISSAWGTDSFQAKLNEMYPAVEKISFDNLILEKIDPSNGYIIMADLEWSDIGAWEALKEALAEGEHANATRGDVLLQDSTDSLVFNYAEGLLVGIDLGKMLVIRTDDVTLVCPKDSVPKIKKLVESLKGTSHEHLT